jgi:hypothetical protein
MHGLRWDMCDPQGRRRPDIQQPSGQGLDDPAYCTACRGGVGEQGVPVAVVAGGRSFFVVWHIGCRASNDPSPLASKWLRRWQGGRAPIAEIRLPVSHSQNHPGVGSRLTQYVPPEPLHLFRRPRAFPGADGGRDGPLFDGTIEPISGN